MAAVSFDGVSKIYPNGETALEGVCLDIQDGELMVVVGPSGCGKSTLLRLLAGLEEISSGTLRIDGVLANHLTPQARNVAMVFQDYALYPTMTVGENLSFPLRMRKLSRTEIRRRVDWAADMLDLGGVLNRLPKTLSGGQRQRVAMGRALVREPSVFLLDEPLSNLDAKLRSQVRTEICDLQKRTGTTMIYVTHDQVEAMTLGHRITVMNGGRIQQVSDPHTLYDHPCNPFVAGFIGTPPMNLFESVVVPQPDADWAIRVGEQVVGNAGNNQVMRRLGGRKSGEASSVPILTGIRPESLRIADSAEDYFMATVLTSEYLGHETLVHLVPGVAAHMTTAEKPWIARFPGLGQFRAGDRLRLIRVSPDDVHLFDPN